jgi:hypothetical protein
VVNQDDLYFAVGAGVADETNYIVACLFIGKVINSLVFLAQVRDIDIDAGYTCLEYGVASPFVEQGAVTGHATRLEARGPYLAYKLGRIRVDEWFAKPADVGSKLDIQGRVLPPCALEFKGSIQGLIKSRH